VIANARMYSVTPEIGALWRDLLGAVIRRSGADVDLVEHPAPQPIEPLWARPDKAAVLMCGLPFSLAEATIPVAAPVPSPAAYGGRPVYWSELVVRRDSPFHRLEDVLGGRLALTSPGSQSGCIAALTLFAGIDRPAPLFAEIVGPTVTPQGSIQAVLDGRADVAPIDGFALGLLRHHAPEIAEGVRTIAHTATTPIPLFVASPGSEAALAETLLTAHDDAELRDLMAAVLVERFVAVQADDYRPLRETRRRSLAYWRDRPLAETIPPAFQLAP